MTKEAIFYLQIASEVLGAPEYESVLSLPHPADSVTIKTNSSLAANILNSTSGTFFRRHQWTHSCKYLLAMLFLIPPVLQCDPPSLHFQPKAKLNTFSHLELILPCYFSAWYLLFQK